MADEQNPDMSDGYYMPSIFTMTCTMQRTLSNKAAIDALTPQVATIQTDVTALKSSRQIAAVATWKVTGNTPSLVSGSSTGINNLVKNSTGNYTFNLNTTISADAPFSIDLKGVSGAMFAYVVSMTTNAVTVQISNLVLLGVTLIAADASGCLIIYK